MKTFERFIENTAGRLSMFIGVVVPIWWSMAVFEIIQDMHSVGAMVGWVVYLGGLFSSTLPFFTLMAVGGYVIIDLNTPRGQVCKKDGANLS
jgi:hypothetical protein